MLAIRRVLAPNPGPFTLDGTNTWIVGERPSVVIDPGPEDRGHLEAVASVAAPASVILLTHHHPDHAPGAAALAERLDVPVLAFSPLAGELRIADGRRVEAGGGLLQAVHTPGHTPDHVAFHDPEAGSLFTGDAVLGRGTSVVDPPEGDLAAYLASLDRMLGLHPKTLYPGHGPVVADGAAKLREYVEHRERREREVLEALSRGPSRPEDLVPVIYVGYPPELHAPAARSVLAHLLKLEREGRVVGSGTGAERRYVLHRSAPGAAGGRPPGPTGPTA
jgi:glyoxylase-like metal-dependent hydrolase (beta-lactamase superfamily II)